MKILLVCAMEKEANTFIKHYNLNKINDNFYNNKNINLIITGVSRNGVIKSLLPIYKKYDLENYIIINIGLVGSNNLNIGDIVVIDKSLGYHFDLTPFGEEKYNSICSPYILNTIKELKKTTCYTSDGFVLKTDIQDTCVFDMELNTIVLFPHKEIYAIKVVSDNLNNNSYNEFEFDKAMNECIKYVDTILEKK